ncbi:hypothetical protein GCM10028816_53460 [Spirosoma lituiforme]
MYLLKLNLILLIIGVSFVNSNGQSQSFFRHYRHFWALRVDKAQDQSLVKQFPDAKMLDAVQMKDRMRKVDQLQKMFVTFQDSTQIDLAKSSRLFLLIFTDPRTGLERTYVWDRVHKLYFEEHIRKSPTGPARLTAELKKLPQFDKSMNVVITTKDDSLQSLLEQQNLKAMSQLAHEHQLPGGETCFGLICDQFGQVVRFTHIELPAFEYIRTDKK